MMDAAATMTDQLKRVTGTAAVAAAMMLGSASIAHACRDTLAPVVERLVDSVVNISTSQTLRGSSGIPLPQVPKGSPFEDFFKEFFENNGDGKPRQRRKVNSLGSGFVIDATGIVVTNNHVIADADEIIVNFNDGSKLKVKEIIGRDPKTDLAMLRVEPKKPLKAVSFGDSSKMRVGDCVIAIGNPFGLGGTVTSGIISAKKRDINSGPYDDFLQTDASINKGNSGGPLFNLDGEVIGVNTAIISPTGGSIGIGFAVPSQTVTYVLEQLREYGETRRGWLGVRIQSVSEEIAESLGLERTKGALVASVTPDSPASKAGMEAGDVILKFNGRDVENMRVLPRIVARTPIGKSVPVEVLRNNKPETLTVTIERLTEQGEKAKAKPSATAKAPGKGIRVLGLVVARVTGELRKKYHLADDIKGTVITEVDPDSAAAEKGLKEGDVILEVTQKEVATPAEVLERIKEMKSAGRKSALFLISGPKGELRFIAVPLGKS